MGMAKARQARYYNARRKDVHFDVGDLVWVRSHPLSKASAKFSAKFAPKWSGPVRLEKKLGPVIMDCYKDFYLFCFWSSHYGFVTQYVLRRRGSDGRGGGTSEFNRESGLSLVGSV